MSLGHSRSLQTKPVGDDLGARDVDGSQGIFKYTDFEFGSPASAIISAKSRVAETILIGQPLVTKQKGDKLPLIKSGQSTRSCPVLGR